YMLPNASLNDGMGEQLPNTGGYINTLDGMLNIHTGELKPHAPAYMSLSQVPARWDPEADTTEVDAFVSGILAEDCIDLWWMFCGYCLYMDHPLPYRVLLTVVGPARSGKTTLLEALRYFLGPQNVSVVPLQSLAGRGNNFTTSAFV